MDLMLAQDIPVPCVALSCGDEDDRLATERWRRATARMLDARPHVTKRLVGSLKTRRRKLRRKALQTLPTSLLEKLGIEMTLPARAIPDLNVADIYASLQRFGIALPRELHCPPLRTTIYHAIVFSSSTRAP